MEPDRRQQGKELLSGVHLSGVVNDAIEVGVRQAKHHHALPLGDPVEETSLLAVSDDAVETSMIRSFVPGCVEIASCFVGHDSSVMRVTP